ncbi:MAG: pseudouridine synthase, partial [Comamonadaceae bacterium]
RATAGLVLFSTDPATRGLYQWLFGERAIRKTYEAIAHWPPGTVLPHSRCSRLVPDDHFMRTREVTGEANAETHLTLLEVRGRHARLALSPVTGRKHQLRVHCNALGIPIVGDALYPALMPFGPDNFARPMQLLARSLSFVDPFSGEVRAFESTLRLDGWPA